MISLLVATLIIAATAAYLVVYFKKNAKWKCVEGKCEQTLTGGTFDLKEICENTCGSDTTSNTQNTTSEPFYYYNRPFYRCNKNIYKCEEVDPGLAEFTNLDSCNENCNPPIIIPGPNPVGWRYWGWRRPWNRGGPYHYGPGRWGPRWWRNNNPVGNWGPTIRPVPQIVNPSLYGPRIRK